MPQYFTNHETIDEQDAVQQIVERRHPLNGLSGMDILLEIQRKKTQFDGDPEMAFSTEQNALVAVNAEKYYRAMVKGGPHSWNMRDRHMADTLERLLHFHGADSKAIIWAHNTHIGDARVTDMSYRPHHGIASVAFGTQRTPGAGNLSLWHVTRFHP